MLHASCLRGAQELSHYGAMNVTLSDNLKTVRM